jgi:hypothetical protein
MNGVNKTCASVAWTPADVQTIHEGLTDMQAVEWLESNERHIQSSIVELGWSVIEALIHESIANGDLPSMNELTDEELNEGLHSCRLSTTEEA